MFIGGVVTIPRDDGVELPNEEGVAAKAVAVDGVDETSEVGEMKSPLKPDLLEPREFRLAGFSDGGVSPIGVSKGSSLKPGV